MTLLEEISEYENIESAFYSCLRGKRKDLAPQLAFLKLDEYINQIRRNLQKGQDYPWGPYKEFYVCDPKRRLVSSAPFIDRVTHKAIYQILDPMIDSLLIENTFACRKGKGNGHAIAKLFKIIKNKPEFYAIKLDVRKYFASIHHGRLLGKILNRLPDDSLAGLFKGILKNHPDCQNGYGLPLGNLTSQIFANFYLNDIDEFCMKNLSNNYVRYMDDLVLVGDKKDQVFKVMKEVIKISKKEKIKFPLKKRVYLKNQSIPFLGFVVNQNGITSLNRNKRRMNRKLNEHSRKNHSLSQIEESKMSYEAWLRFPLKLIEHEKTVPNESN